MTSLAVAMGSIKWILFSDLLLEWKIWTHLACWGLPALIPWRKKITCCRHFKLIVFFGQFRPQNCKKWRKRAKTALAGLLCFKNIWLFSPSLKISKSGFLMKWLSFCYVMNSLMIKCEVKMTGYSVSLVPFFMEQDLVLLYYVSSKPTLSFFHSRSVDIGRIVSHM